jgi:hypothetical protein
MQLTMRRNSTLSISSFDIGSHGPHDPPSENRRPCGSLGSGFATPSLVIGSVSEPSAKAFRKSPAVKVFVAMIILQHYLK